MTHLETEKVQAKWWENVISNDSEQVTLEI